MDDDHNAWSDGDLRLIEPIKKLSSAMETAEEAAIPWHVLGLSSQSDGLQGTIATSYLYLRVMSCFDCSLCSYDRLKAIFSLFKYYQLSLWIAFIINSIP